MNIQIIDNNELRKKGELVYFCNDLCDHDEIEAYEYQGDMYPPSMNIIYGIQILGDHPKDEINIYYCKKALKRRLDT